jgi:hypothetical protein
MLHTGQESISLNVELVIEMNNPLVTVSKPQKYRVDLQQHSTENHHNEIQNGCHGGHFL